MCFSEHITLVGFVYKHVHRCTLIRACLFQWFDVEGHEKDWFVLPVKSMQFCTFSFSGWKCRGHMYRVAVLIALHVDQFHIKPSRQQCGWILMRKNIMIHNTQVLLFRISQLLINTVSFYTVSTNCICLFIFVSKRRTENNTCYV